MGHYLAASPCRAGPPRAHDDAPTRLRLGTTLGFVSTRSDILRDLVWHPGTPSPEMSHECILLDLKGPACCQEKVSRSDLNPRAMMIRNGVADIVGGVCRPLPANCESSDVAARTYLGAVRGMRMSGDTSRTPHEHRGELPATRHNSPPAKRMTRTRRDQ